MSSPEDPLDPLRDVLVIDADFFCLYSQWDTTSPQCQVVFMELLAHENTGMFPPHTPLMSKLNMSKSCAVVTAAFWALNRPAMY